MATVRGRPVRLATGLAALIGVLLLAVAAIALFAVDDTCPQWEDEGPMAAPRSPYSLVVCGPGAMTPPLTPAVIVLGLLTVVAGVALARRARSWPRLTAGLVGLALVPTLLLGLLHVSLPRDCLTGRTEHGGCSRDREMR